MKIAMVTDAYNFGRGGDVATIRLAEGLKKRGHTIVVVSTRSVQQENFFKVKGFYPPNAREACEKMDFQFGFPEKSVLRRAFAEVDLVQIQHPFYLSYGASRVAKKMRKPVIAAFHCQPQNILAAMKLSGRFYEWLLEKTFNYFLFNQVPIVQCPSKFAADLLRSTGCRAELRVVSNGIPEEYVPTLQPRPAEFGDKLVLLNIGRHAAEKRQELIVEGLKRSKHAANILLLLCGRGEDTELLKTMAAGLPVPPLIRYVTQEEKMTFLNTSDLFVQASIAELESLACLEALGCGTPCLISDSRHSAASQFALDERFIFGADNPDSLAAKIDYWYENRAQLRAMRQNALAMAENYRLQTCLDKMEALYADALRAAGKRTS